MTASVTALAPGKLFLMGEYAVLDGVPAIVAAVPPFVKVQLRRTPGRSTLRVAAPQLAAAAEVPASALPPAEGPLRFALACLHVLREELGPAALAGIDISIEGTEPATKKLGLGLSAAISAATTAGLLALSRVLSPNDGAPAMIFRQALAAHRLAQDGRGSGADVAASVFGGVLWFVPTSLETVLPQPIQAAPQWQLLAAWTGMPAATTELVSLYREACHRAPAAYQRFLRDSEVAVEQCRRALEHPNARIDEAFDLALCAMRRFSRATGFSPLTPPLERAIEVAWNCGVPAKWSGAGGGDCVIALASSPAKAEEVLQAWREVGLHCWAAHWVTEGVHYG